MGTESLIGLDYGSKSARGVLVDASTGDLAASHIHPYRHGVITKALPSGRTLPLERFSSRLNRRGIPKSADF
jgi:L-ribulokinase